MHILGLAFSTCNRGSGINQIKHCDLRLLFFRSRVPSEASCLKGILSILVVKIFIIYRLHLCIAMAREYIPLFADTGPGQFQLFRSISPTRWPLPIIVDANVNSQRRTYLP
jgi:hypothetical protein